MVVGYDNDEREGVDGGGNGERESWGRWLATTSANSGTAVGDDDTSVKGGTVAGNDERE
jgi:hypothetical protein